MRRRLAARLCSMMQLHGCSPAGGAGGLNAAAASASCATALRPAPSGRVAVPSAQLHTTRGGRASTSHRTASGVVSSRVPIGGRPFASAAAAVAAARSRAVAVSAALNDDADATPRPPAAGRLVEYKRDGRTGMALLLEPDGKRNWVAVDEREQRYSLKPAQIEYVLPGDGHTPASLAAEAAAAAAGSSGEMAGLLEDAWELLGGGACPPSTTAAARPPPPPEPVSLPSLAALLFGPGPGPGAVAAARRLVSSTPEGAALFKRAPGPARGVATFVPRPPAEVRSVRGAAAAAARAAEEAAAVAADFSALAASSDWDAKPATVAVWADTPGPHAARLSALDAFALEAASPADAATAIALLRSITPPSAFPPTSDGAAALLSAVGARPRHEVPALRRAGVTHDFGEALERVAAALAACPPPDPDAGHRVDLTATQAIYTIDDASTTEIDDGVSVVRDEGAGEDFASATFWVHIADPGRWVPPPPAARSPDASASPSEAGDLAAEAARRTRTVYLPTGSIPMFPRTLSDGPFSLRPGIPTAAVSIGVRLRRDGSLDAGSIQIAPSTVAPAAQLTYEGVDGVLAGGDGGHHTPPTAAADLRLLAAAATARRTYRTAQGASTFNLPEADVRVVEEGRGAAGAGPAARPVGGGLAVRVAELRSDTPARLLVSELMILANEAVATAAGRAGLPLPYRGQVPPVADDGEGSGPDGGGGDDGDPDDGGNPSPPPSSDGLVAAATARSRMMRGVLDCAAPAPHAGLGLGAYTQFTSPIRRWGDLAGHWQVKAWLRAGGGPAASLPAGALPFPTPDAMAAAVDGPAAAARELNGLERGADAAWLARWFDAGGASATYPATLLTWLRPDAGVARVLLTGLGVEGVAVLARPAVPGDALTLAWDGLGGSRGTDLRFADVGTPPVVADVFGEEDGGGGGGGPDDESEEEEG